MESQTSPPDITSMPRAALEAHLESLGIAPGHAPGVIEALHRDDLPLERTRGLGRRDARTLIDGSSRPRVRLRSAHLSADGTEKLVFVMDDGAAVEGVLMPGARRISLCVSSQAGCAMGCGFCATATLGLRRPLSAGEIAGQVRLARAHALRSGLRVENLVLMGMGEPLHHYASTRDALRILTDHNGQMLAPRRVRVATVGLPAGIRRLGEDFRGRVQLALSLNAGTQATRERLMPVAAAHHLDALKDALAAYPLRKANRYLMLSYVVLPGVNDSDAELEGVVAFASGLRAVVNLIPFNPFPGSPFSSPGQETTARMKAFLADRGVMATIRRPRGRGSAAACGQLVAGSRAGAAS